MVRKDDLQFHDLVLYQDTELPCFTEDPVHLVHFLRLKPGEPVLDLGCGTGVISILGEGYTHAAFTGIDIDERLVELAKRSANENGQAIRFLTMDAVETPVRLGYGAFSAVVCNPPYFHAGDLPHTRVDAVARHMDEESFLALLKSIFSVLKNGGRAFFCYPVAGMAYLLARLTEHRLIPKRIRFVAASREKTPFLMLVECKKDGGDGVVLEKTVYADEEPYRAV